MTSSPARPDRGWQHQLPRFAAVGVVGFAVDAAMFYLLLGTLTPSPTLARALAFLPATVATWWLNRSFVFDAREGTWWTQYLRYLGVQGSGIVVNFLAFSLVSALVPAWPSIVALAAGSVAAMVGNFVGSRKIAFVQGVGGDPHSAARTVPRWVVALAVPLAFGALSLLLGQDANWDLLNYHRYNPWALLEGRLRTDWAPANFQSYFNPLLDVPYFWMTAHWSPRLAGFAMGVLQGLAFLPLWGIARLALPAARERTTAWLAVAGLLSPTFFSEVGNTMGDASTTPLVLLSLWMLLRAWPTLATRPLWRVVCVGLGVGLAVGLKLTNACYAVALVGVVLLAPVPVARRLGLAAAAGVGVLVGMAITGGFWWLTMWREFGNPFFPQFNAIFHSPFADALWIVDVRWRPRSLLEALFFPFVFTLDPLRWGEVKLLPLLWPIAYTLLGAWALASLVRVWRAGARLSGVVGAFKARLGPPAALVGFVALGYLVWMKVFAIGRYASAMEVLLPLVVWIALDRLTASRARPARLAGGLVALAVLVGLVRWETWGTASWAETSYRVDVPAIDRPGDSAVLVMAYPIAWVLPSFPKELAYVYLNPGLENEGYRRRAREIVAQRPGPLYALLPGEFDTRLAAGDRLNAALQARGIRAASLACRGVTAVLARASRYKAFRKVEGTGDAPCAFELPAGERMDEAGLNRRIAEQASRDLAVRGLAIDPAACSLRDGYIGAKRHVFQFCRVERLAGAAPDRQI